MKKAAFKMQLHRDQAAEYQRRHDEIWEELTALLKSIGVEDYSIFLDEETYALFGVLKIENPERLDELPAHPVMQRWWKYMGDIMDANPDHSPVSTPLKEVFYLA
ncbi:L-rhamnose mutarotase [Pseudarcicella hirudinis]|uniref:L-rhamnose mutarotase n=1 Tax=Pseudarcicella hirudinis TaxID=1079859 RepID=A0A1I5XX25_9BACT|nr:L-rhamnose mutarotase [Pseudarcicella hirudinis]SFQ36474.1 L-rhamnose mutarotase [Pseudarcicella hirudinis]